MRTKSIIFAILTFAIVGIYGFSHTDSKAETPETDMQISEIVEAQPHETPYIWLTYGGLDVTPQHDYASYTVAADREFVAGIWETAGYVHWTEYDGETQAMVTIELRFTGQSDEITLQLDPNDIGWVTADLAPWERAVPTYYAVPTGTYKKLSAMLTEYSAAHFTAALRKD